MYLLRRIAFAAGVCLGLVAFAALAVTVLVGLAVHALFRIVDRAFAAWRNNTAKPHE